MKYSHTRKALSAYKCMRPVLNRMAEEIETLEACNEYLQAELVVLQVVQVAFFMDTSHINSFEDCMLLELQDIERVVKHELPNSL